MNFKRRGSPIRKELNKLDFRLEQVEMALQHLMYVVANQDEELDDFKSSLSRADKNAVKLVDVMADVMNSEGGEA